jgi:hypothetical protein
MDVPEIDLATLGNLIDDASGHAVQLAEAAALSRLIRVAHGDTDSACCRFPAGLVERPQLRQFRLGDAMERGF